MKKTKEKKTKKTQSVSPPVPSEPILHWHVTLIEVSEPFLLEELKASKQVGSMILKLISNRMAVIAPGNEDLLLKKLLKAGHTPKVIKT